MTCDRRKHLAAAMVVVAASLSLASSSSPSQSIPSVLPISEAVESLVIRLPVAAVTLEPSTTVQALEVDLAVRCSDDYHECHELRSAFEWTNRIEGQTLTWTLSGPYELEPPREPRTSRQQRRDGPAAQLRLRYPASLPLCLVVKGRSLVSVHEPQADLVVDAVESWLDLSLDAEIVGEVTVETPAIGRHGTSQWPAREPVHLVGKGAASIKIRAAHVRLRGPGLESPGPASAWQAAILGFLRRRKPQPQPAWTREPGTLPPTLEKQAHNTLMQAARFLSRSDRWKAFLGLVRLTLVISQHHHRVESPDREYRAVAWRMSERLAGRPRPVPLDWPEELQALESRLWSALYRFPEPVSHHVASAAVGGLLLAFDSQNDRERHEQRIHRAQCAQS